VQVEVPNVTVKLLTDIETARTTQYQDEFIANVAKTLGVDVSRIKITKVKAGSVYISFDILPDPSDTVDNNKSVAGVVAISVPLAELANSFIAMAQDPASSLSALMPIDLRFVPIKETSVISLEAKADAVSFDGATVPSVEKLPSARPSEPVDVAPAPVEKSLSARTVPAAASSEEDVKKQAEEEKKLEDVVQKKAEEEKMAVVEVKKKQAEDEKKAGTEVAKAREEKKKQAEEEARAGPPPFVRTPSELFGLVVSHEAASQGSAAESAPAAEKLPSARPVESVPVAEKVASARSEAMPQPPPHLEHLYQAPAELAPVAEKLPSARPVELAPIETAVKAVVDSEVAKQKSKSGRGASATSPNDGTNEFECCGAYS